MTHICVNDLTIIGSDNGLSPGQRQAIIWTNAGILLTGPLGTNFNEILIKILAFSFKKMHLKVSPAKWRPFCLGLNVLTHWGLVMIEICIRPLDNDWFQHPAISWTDNDFFLNGPLGYTSMNLNQNVQIVFQKNPSANVTVTDLSHYPMAQGK